MKNREEIESRLIEEMVVHQTEVTIFEPKTVIRGIITAFAGTIAELWNDVFRERRKMHLNTASGTSLDELLGERGIKRKSATKAGVLITFKGTNGTVIPAGSICKNNSTGIGYQTITTITLGQKNPDLVFNNISGLDEPSIANTVWAECTVAGSIGNCQVNTITGKPAIAGLTSCSNPTPSQGGSDAETDPLFRERGRNYISILNQGTEAFYDAITREIDPRVYRIKAKKDYAYFDAIKLILINESGANFTPEELKFIASEVQSRHRAFTRVTCQNIAFTPITIKARIRIKSGYTLEDIFIRVADAYARYFNWKSWEFGAPISVDNVFDVCSKVPGVEDTELNTFVINASNPKNSSISQTLYSQTSTGATTSTITDSGANYTADALIGKYVRIITGTGSGQTRQIIANTSTQITIAGTWDINPPNGSQFIVIELYILTSRTQLAINEDSIPYFFGLELTDISNPSQLITKKVQNIKIIQQPNLAE